MKTNKNIKNENTRLNSIIRRLALVALSGVAIINVLKAGDPESVTIEKPDYEAFYSSYNVTTRNSISEDTFDFDIFQEYKGSPAVFKFDYLEYRLQIALEEEPEPEMQIEDWMLDLSYWNALIKEKFLVTPNNSNTKSDTQHDSCLSEYRISIALQEESEPEMEIEDWMLDMDEFMQRINFAKK